MTTSHAVADIFIDRLPVEEIRRKWAAKQYGEPGPSAEHMKGWLKMGGRNV